MFLLNASVKEGDIAFIFLDVHLCGINCYFAIICEKE